MHVVTVVGARPQFIKAAPLSRALRLRHRETLVHTGQHYDDRMSQVFFDELDLPAPDVNLGVGSAPHGEQTARMLIGIERLLRRQRPDWVVVLGDTNSTLAGALAAAKLGVPVAHVEAGMRSYRRSMPEEVNRVLTDHVSDLLLVTSDRAAENLRSEGITARTVVVGDLMADALCGFLKRIRADVETPESPYAVLTFHRAQNTDNAERVRGIVQAVNRCGLPVIFPVHPRTQRALESTGARLSSNVELRPPQGYLEMMGLVQRCAFVVTDSGGLMREAYLLGKKCVCLRGETEWTELVESGWCRLTGADPSRIREGIDWALTPPPIDRPAYFGDGHAAERIVAALERGVADA